LIEGIPACASLRRESAVEMDAGLRAAPPAPARDGDGPWVEGAFPNVARNLALRVSGVQAYRVALGKGLRPGVRERYNSAQGTIEMLVKLNSPPGLASAHATGIPFRIPIRPGADSVSFWDKNLVTMSDGETTCEVGRIGPCQYAAGPAELTPGRWHHLAVVWKRSNECGRFYGRLYLNGVGAPAALGGQGPLRLVEFAEHLLIESRGHDVTLDEVRISDTDRYEGADRFVPSSKLHQPDEHTLLLLHLDGNLEPAR
jgi:hypothetical protein